MTAFSSCNNDDDNRSENNIDDSVFIKLPVSQVDSFDPYLCETDFNSKIGLLLFDGLIKIEEDLSYSYAVASEVKVNGNSIFVEIRDDAYFSDSTSVTSRDVVDSFRKAKESDAYSSKLSNIESATSSGDTGVVFTLEKSDIYSVKNLDFPIVKSVEEDNEENEITIETESSDNIPIGCGRYKFEDGSIDTLILNEYWYGETLPKIRRIKLVHLIDFSSAVNSMETGNISYLFQDLSSGIYNRVNANTSKILMTNLVYLGINSYSNSLSKPEVRQAISLVINKDKIAEKSFLGYAQKTRTPFYPEWNEIEALYFDKEDENENFVEAKNLLDKAGYSETNELGIRSSEDMKLTLLVNSDNAYKVAAANEIAADLKSVGIEVVLNKLPFDEYKTELAYVNYDLYIGEVKLSNDMSLGSFFESDGATSFGINRDTDIVKQYELFRAGQVSLQRFVDYFNVYLPFIPLCYRIGIASYTNELSYGIEGTHSDIFAGIYSWEY